MPMADDLIKVYLEFGHVRTFAVAPDWPGWCRSARDEASALQALVDYGQRYKQALKDTNLDFHPPSSASELEIVERLPGNATTDFGAPAMILPGDDQPVNADELMRWKAILDACWKTFDRVAVTAKGKVLRTGPRGGGRDLIKIIAHAQEAEIAYLSMLGGKWQPGPAIQPDQAKQDLREAILATLDSSVRGEIPAQGPRGGRRWLPCYFVRKVAWHALDHAWEIEDRIN
jgi:hypothetical protein